MLSDQEKTGKGEKQKSEKNQSSSFAVVAAVLALAFHRSSTPAASPPGPHSSLAFSPLTKSTPDSASKETCFGLSETEEDEDVED